MQRPFAWIAFLLSVVFAGIAAYAAQPQPVFLRIDYDDDGTILQCKQLKLELTFEGRTFTLNGKNGKVAIPAYFLELKNSGQSLEDRTLEVSVDCDGRVQHESDIAVGFLFSQEWRFGVDYPPFEDENLYLASRQSGQWISFLHMEGEPGVLIWHAHVESPPSLVITRLEQEQPTAKDGRARDIAYALAALKVNYTENRARMLDLLRECASSNESNVAGCDRKLFKQAMHLYLLGDEEILKVLLAAGDLPKEFLQDSNTFGDLDELYEFLLLEKPEVLVQVWKERDKERQDNICKALQDAYLATRSTEFNDVMTKIRASGEARLVQCLSDIQTANEQRLNRN